MTGLGKLTHSTRRFGMVAAALSIAAGTWVAIGTSGTAFAFSNPNCGSGGPGGAVETCIGLSNWVLGTNSYGTLTASASTETPETIKTCLNLNGSSWGCTASRTVPPGQTISLSVTAIPLGGDWCANTWDPNHVEVGHRCFNITNVIET